jgi:hypothetical protein
MRYSTLEICAVVLLLSESRAIINDLDVILHGFMLQVIYTTVFRVTVKRLSNLRLRVRLSNRLIRKTVVKIILVLVILIYNILSLSIYYKLRGVAQRRLEG